MNILTVLDKAKALELADFLDDLSVNGSERNEGLCCEIRDFISIFLWEDGVPIWLYRSFALWPKFSGYSDYPVPHRKGAKVAMCTINRWDKRTQYGKDRRELCTFLANLIRSQCDE